jgi:L-alanine-DL-glutamate epimerase-like enolase superfamily enzyme
MYNTQVIAAEVVFETQPFIKPLILSTGAIDGITLATATVRVRANGRDSIGRGSIYLSDLWAWPDARWSHEQRDRQLRAFVVHLAKHLRDFTSDESLHPLELGLRLHESANHADAPQFAPIPVLARSMCLSPFDAAIHDATGRAFKRSAFATYDTNAAIPSADHRFTHGACSAIASTIRRRPLQSLPAWLIIGKNDDVYRDIRPWSCDRGYRCFKLKIMGQDAREDAERTVEVYKAVRQLGVDAPLLTVDSNEANPSVESVIEYLRLLRDRSPDAYDALQYLEQPTGREIRQHAFTWGEVTKRKRVLLDEGLTDASLFQTAVYQGWSGFALKTCKGHSFALMAAAWAHQNGLVISLQDLTNPGYAMIHSALCGAYLPTINGVELNSPQFTPAANERFVGRYPGLFNPHDGAHRLEVGNEIGLGTDELAEED